MVEEATMAGLAEAHLPKATPQIVNNFAPADPPAEGVVEEAVAEAVALPRPRTTTTMTIVVTITRKATM